MSANIEPILVFSLLNGKPEMIAELPNFTSTRSDIYVISRIVSYL